MNSVAALCLNIVSDTFKENKNKKQYRICNVLNQGCFKIVRNGNAKL